jgi:opacity protein-like surface antigen
MRNWILLVCTFGCVAAASAQVAEISVSGGASRFTGGNIGTENPGDTTQITVGGGFRMDARLTLNSYRFFGHEFGYGYSRSTFQFPTSGDVSVPVHQGYYDFLAYGTPEGKKIRPFVAGGVQFSSFFPPGSSSYYGNQTTKYGFNYGAGVKIKVSPMIGIRFDVRQYNMGHPFEFYNQSGRYLQTSFTGGVSFNL